MIAGPCNELVARRSTNMHSCAGSEGQYPTGEADRQLGDGRNVKSAMMGQPRIDVPLFWPRQSRSRCGIEHGHAGVSSRTR